MKKTTKQGGKVVKKAPAKKAATAQKAAPAAKQSTAKKATPAKQTITSSSPAAVKLAIAAKAPVVTTAKVVKGSGSRVVKAAKPAKPVRESTPRAPRVVVTPDALPKLLQTTMGVRWTRILKEKGWTLATLPLDKLVHITGRMTVPALCALLDVTEDALRTRCTTDGVTLKAGGGRAPSAVRVPRGAAASSRTADRTDAGGATRVRKDTSVDLTRALVDDRAQAVLVSSLPVGARFKTPDDMEAGVRGWTGTVLRHGVGSTSVSGRWDYIASGTCVVPLDAEVAS